MADKAKDLESSMREQQEGTAPSPSTMGLDKATVEAQAAADGQGKKNKRKRKHKKKKSKKNKAAESNDQAQNDPVPAPEQVLVGDPHLAHLPRFTLPEDIDLESHHVNHMIEWYLDTFPAPHRDNMFHYFVSYFVHCSGMGCTLAAIAETRAWVAAVVDRWAALGPAWFHTAHPHVRGQARLEAGNWLGMFPDNLMRWIARGWPEFAQESDSESGSDMSE